MAVGILAVAALVIILLLTILQAIAASQTLRDDFIIKDVGIVQNTIQASPGSITVLYKPLFKPDWIDWEELEMSVVYDTSTGDFQWEVAEIYV